MVKRNLCVYVCSELVEIAKLNNFNLSQEFNEYLKQRLFSFTNIPDQNKKETLQKLVVETQNKLISFQNELKSLETVNVVEIKAKSEELKKKMEEAMR